MSGYCHILHKPIYEPITSGQHIMPNSTLHIFICFNIKCGFCIYPTWNLSSLQLMHHRFFFQNSIISGSVGKVLVMDWLKCQKNYQNFIKLQNVTKITKLFTVKCLTFNKWTERSFLSSSTLKPSAVVVEKHKTLQFWNPKLQRTTHVNVQKIQFNAFHGFFFNCFLFSFFFPYFIAFRENLICFTH